MGLTVIIILFILSLFLLGALRTPVIGVIGYLFIYIIFNHHIWWGERLFYYLSRPSLLAIIMLTIGCAINSHKLNWNISNREKLIYLFSLTAWFVTYVFGVGVHEESIFYLNKLLKMSFFIFLLLRSVHTIQDYDKIIWTFVLGGVFLAIYARHGGSFASGRLNNIGGIDFSEANAFASFMSMNMIFIGYHLLRVQSWKKLPFIFSIALMLNAMLLTQSRSVFLGLICGAIVVIVRTPNHLKKRVYSYAILGVVLISMLAHDQFWNRMKTIDMASESLIQTNHINIDKPIDRVDFWKASIRIFSDYPMGIGVKNFTRLVTVYDQRNSGRDAHNTYVLCYSEIGILGITIYLLIIISALRQLKRTREAVKGHPEEENITIKTTSLFTVLVVYLTGSMVTHSYLYIEMIWILLALPICLEKSVENLLEGPTEVVLEKI